MKKPLHALLVCALLGTAGLLHAAEYFADQVVSYVAGSSVGSYTDPTAALGKPGGNIGTGTFNPFSPNFATTELARIGFGGELTLQLSNYVTVDYTPGVREIGIWENVGLVAGTGGATNPATVFGADSAVVSVSADGVNWFSLNSGQPILFTLPGNYYANATATNDPPPANPVLADFGKPFTGALSDFDGKSFSDVLATLNGSAGGTWLDLDETGLSQVGYIRFDGVASGQTLEINGVGINGALAGAAVPEPNAVHFLFLCAAGIAGFYRRREGRRTVFLRPRHESNLGLASAAFRGAHPSRVLVSASRRNELSLRVQEERMSLCRPALKKVREGEDAFASTRDGCAPRKSCFRAFAALVVS